MRLALRVAVAAIGLAVVVASPAPPARATSIVALTAAELVDFAAQSSDVVRARFVRWERKPDSARGRRPDGSFSVPEMYNHEALARFYVEEVVGGDATLARKEITVVDTSNGGMESTRDALLFLRREGQQFSQVHWGGFAVTGAMVQVPLGTRSEVPWTEIAALVRKVNLVRVTWTGSVATTATRGDTLHVELVAKNEGPVATQVLAPSHCQSVKAYPLAEDGRWHARRDNWFETPSTWMAALDEAPLSLARGASHVFRYDIPLASMKMDAAESYDLVLGMSPTFCLLPSPEPGVPPRLHANAMADHVTRVALTGPRAAGAAVAEAGAPSATDAPEVASVANDAGATPHGSLDAAAPSTSAAPAPSAGGCRGGCATAPSPASSPLATSAALSLGLAVALALARGLSRRTTESRSGPRTRAGSRAAAESP